jgi:hypothetical protein
MQVSHRCRAEVADGYGIDYIMKYGRYLYIKYIVGRYGNCG